MFSTVAVVVSLFAVALAAPATPNKTMSIMPMRVANGTAGPAILLPPVGAPSPLHPIGGPMKPPMGGFGGDHDMMGGHGGPRGGMMKKGKCPNAVELKVNDCLTKFSRGPVNVFVYWNPKMIEMINQMMDQWEVDQDDTQMQTMKQMAAKILNSEQGALIKKFMNVMMAGHAAKFVDHMLQDLPKEKTNVAWGSAGEWYYINGAEAPQANWTAFHDEVDKQFNFSSVKDIIKMFGGDKMMREHGPRDNDDDDDSKENKPVYGSFVPGNSGIVASRPAREDKKKAPMMMDHKQEGFKMHAKTNISENLKWGMVHQIAGKTVPFANKRPASFANPSFQIVLTSEDFDASQIGGTIDLIIDIMGRFSNQTTRARYTTENIFIASPPEAAEAVIPTTRYRVCQRNGGVSDVQPPKPTRPPRPSTVATPVAAADGRVANNVNGTLAIRPAPKPVATLKPLPASKPTKAPLQALQALMKTTTKKSN